LSINNNLFCLTHFQCNIMLLGLFLIDLSNEIVFKFIFVLSIDKLIITLSYNFQSPLIIFRIVSQIIKWFCNN